ncbi:bifunctional pyr operon transcriptional regulator/uracil phosphoribosyltransferase PyrR [Peptoniphilus sp. KCTC 25270]|uniref:bifunctional pyr operon transcriptional regulator/uracil phosphoribosyltransferase PyrR n=1 Tax=Peptoniphilus sp. KCTC 25270 TaxID=2897414 RepID=UPI001E3D0C29|nr:bifunctional pyr operon transcriptional regulator/uracil phosphoribosyltransferase PyrR [Peptoniphilus sp. KCTC 25270]MCD1146970.1 bifunctional pyr operon transcriptional regulator/uracil phosphoribosyltransferase PyrR [Peptoniphilus sp. KCTC 25270]
MHQIFDEKEIKRAISRISHEIIEKNKGVNQIVLVGIKTRGIEISKRIQKNLEELEEVSVPLFELDPSFFRDDNKRTDTLDPMNFMGKITEKDVILVDDVIYTGRTVRAALDALMLKDRPKTVQLVALVDRGHRELPIRGDYIGKNIPTSREEKVVVYLRPHEEEDAIYIDN